MGRTECDARNAERSAERDLLEARLDDAIAQCERGAVARLAFLNPRDQKRAERFLRARGAWEQAWLWGGYAEAERACLFLLPDYLLACLSASVDACDAEEVCALLGEEVTEAVCAIRIKGSGYRTLMHRDFLGSVLGLGIDRDAIGDIAVQDPHTAVVFCPHTLGVFLKETLVKVGNDTVKCMDYTPDEQFTDGRNYRHISDTVASERLDCVVAALCNFSRDDAQNAVRSGLVEVDFEPEERVDFVLHAPVTISVRGQGRFILRAFDGETRKGRLRLRADQLI
ncbi:MAG: hypothetical protein IJX80_00155 [Clostridia bacterium]|nr:hypothetical protein [Clostridia bacterium]